MSRQVEHHYVVWSDDLTWCKPSGKKTGAHPGKIGWGHEEWNGNPKRKFRGWRGFHTQAHSKRVVRLATGDQPLSIVMTASRKGQRYLVGIACDVRDAWADEEFLENLNLYDDWRDAWKSPELAKFYRHDKRRFWRVWEEEYEWLAWKCPNHLYWWPSRPIEISNSAIKLSSHKTLTYRYGISQPVAVTKHLIELLKDAGCPKAVLQWLRLANVSKTHQPKAPMSGKAEKDEDNRTNGSANRAYYRRVIADKKKINPRHTNLQNRYFSYLGGPSRAVCNYRYVDVVAYGADAREGLIEKLIEIKPTWTVSDTRFAFRTALGQLLEAKWRLVESVVKKPQMIVVLSHRPDSRTLQFAKKIGFTCAWPKQAARSFVHST